LPHAGAVSGSNTLTSLTITGGDFNASGLVDAADYVLWRKTAINGQQGFNVWRSNFGRTLGSGSSITASAGVPEPATLSLLPLVASCCVLRRSAWV